MSLQVKPETLNIVASEDLVPPLNVLLSKNSVLLLLGP